jgi:tripartite-type tricarboxylate transporter receptor subunit TctC
MQDLIAGRIDYQCPDSPIAIPQIESKMVKAIAVLTRDRSPGLPAVASAHEQGLTNFDAANWFALFFPKATPAPIVQRLHAAAIATLEGAGVKLRMHEIGADVTPPERRSPEYLQRFIEGEIDKWAGPIKASGAAIEN